MARTPLLQSIQRRLAQIRANNAVNQASDHFPSRRQFVVGALAATALAATPKWAQAGKKQPSIAIVGAGMAGLSCVLDLADRGIQSTIYEATHRVGGRMFSNSRYWRDGQTSEWCGELIDTGHKTVRHLAHRFGLPLDDLLAAQPKNSEDTYFFNNAYYSQAVARADFLQLVDVVDADLSAAGYPTRFDSYTAAGHALDHMSIYDWIESRIPNGHRSPLGQLLDVAYNIEYGAETNDQSSLNLLYLLGYQASPKEFAVFGESDERFHIRGGNEQLPKAIAQHLGANFVRYGHRLMRLEQQQNAPCRLTFQTDGGATADVLADVVVLALPFSVLREIDYSKAGFDARKHQAIQQLGRGRSGKLQLQFNSRAWNKTGAWPGISNGNSYSDTGFQASWDVSRGQAGGSGVLVLFSGGDTSGSMATRRPFATVADPMVALDAARGLQQVARVFPGLQSSWNGLATQSLPHLCPNFRASYAYYRVGQYTAFGGYEAAPQGRIIFCGDHTSQDFQGYMEGAASEGARAAKDVAKQLARIRWG